MYTKHAHYKGRFCRETALKNISSLGLIEEWFGGKQQHKVYPSESQNYTDGGVEINFLMFDKIICVCVCVC